MSKPLNRKTHDAGEAPSVRIVHLGLGAFHRAHQAWYTQRAGDGWGIASFTGRSPKAAEELSSQDGLFTLVERTADGDKFEIIDSIVEAHDGADLASLIDLLQRPEVGIVTLTVTEAGYRLKADGSGPDTDDEAVAADLAALRAVSEELAAGTVPVTELALQSVVARLVVGMSARRAAGAGPIAIVSCDNLPGNGAATRAAVLGTAELVDAQLAAWINDNVSFVDTSIDRITPRTTDADREAVLEATGFEDISPVVTEPFASWVLQGEFPAGRPEWEKAGAVFVDDLDPFERRKLWLLNGSHSLMAYAASLRGHQTVSEALADPVVDGWVEDFWDACAQHLVEEGLEVPAYREALRERFANPRIAHHLAQIGMDGSLKLAARALPVFELERAAGRSGVAALRPVAAWMDKMVQQTTAGDEVQDPAADKIVEAAKVDGTKAQTRALLAVIDASLAKDDDVVSELVELRGTFAN